MTRGMIAMILDLGIRLATFVAFAGAYFRKSGAGLQARNRAWGSAASLPDPVAGKCSSLPAGSKIYHKRLITLAIIDKIGLISALKQKFSLISGRREPPAQI